MIAFESSWGCALLTKWPRRDRWPLRKLSNPTARRMCSSCWRGLQTCLALCRQRIEPLTNGRLLRLFPPKCHIFFRQHLFLCPLWSHHLFSTFYKLVATCFLGALHQGFFLHLSLLSIPLEIVIDDELDAVIFWLVLVRIVGFFEDFKRIIWWGS